MLQKRVMERMDAVGLKPATLAKAIGLNASYVRDIIRGKSKKPSAENLSKLATALKTTPDYLLGADKGPESGDKVVGTPVKYGGVVQAGAFLAVDEYFNQDEVEVPDYVTANPKYGRAEQYTWRVAGDSLDAARIHDGMWVVGVPYDEYVDRYGDIESGRLVVVERLRYGGSERELTVKAVRFFRDRMELHPRSTNTSHKPIIVPYDARTDSDTESVRLLAVVVAAYMDLSQPL